MHADLEAMAAEIARVCGPAEAAGYLRFVDYARELYRLEMRRLHRPQPRLAAQTCSRPTWPGCVALGGFRRLAPKVSAVPADPRTQRVFSFQAMYAGLSPHDALAIYAVIAYMDSVAGVFFPRGGMHAVPRALAGAAEKHGVRVPLRHRRSPGWSPAGGRARAVHTADGERIPADVVVLNPDLPVAYRDLLPPSAAPRGSGG